MKYGLVVYLRNECYKIEGISKIPGFEYINESKLKDIVEFTNELYMPISKETVEGKFIKLTWRFWIVNPMCLLTMQKSWDILGKMREIAAPLFQDLIKI